MRDRFQSHFDSLRQLLGVVARQPRFQSAVAYSSPAAANMLWCHFSTPSGVRNSKCKRRELLAMRYLQRFVTKCETAAFVGPTATGRITRAPNCVDYRFDPADYEPATFVSTRILVQLARHLRRDPRVLTNLRVRCRSGTSLLSGSVVSHPSVGVMELSSECLEVLRATVRSKQVGELCQSVNWSDKLVQVVYALLWLGLLTDELDALPQIANPLTRVGQLITRAGVAFAPEAKLLRVLTEAMNGWNKADAQGRSALLEAVNNAMIASGIAPPAPEAQFYADALAIVEDGVCAASTLCLDETWAEPVLGELETALRRTLRRRLPTGISDIAARLRSEHAGHAPLGPLLAWSEVSNLSGPGPVADEDLSGFPSCHVVTSPDVMIAARDVECIRRGEFSLVLSESHSAVGCAGFQTRVIPNSHEWLKSVSDFLTAQLAPAEPVLVTTAPTNKTWYVGPLPGVRYLEVGSAAPQGTDLIYLDDLEVVVEGEEVKLVNRTSGGHVALLPNGPRGRRFGVLDAFRPPTFEPRRGPGPRERRGRIVEKRESWVLTLDDRPAAGAESFETFVWAQHVRMRNRLPRWVFVHPADERKPICIDMANPFLCEELLRQVRRNACLKVEEMHPDPTEAWVIGPDGHHLSELRLLYAAAS